MKPHSYRVAAFLKAYIYLIHTMLAMFRSENALLHVHDVQYGLRLCH